jgi:uncharacterized protein YwqG
VFAGLVKGAMHDSARQRLVDGGLTGKLVELLLARSQPAVGFTTHTLPHGTPSVVGLSRLGGAPDLNEGFAWPQWNERPLAFLGQLNLADVSRFPCCAPLPQSGLLSFFYDQDQQTWGFDPKDRGSWLVHFEQDLTGLRSAKESGAVPSAPFAPCSLIPTEILTLPAPNSLTVETLDPSAADRAKYYDILDGWDEDSGDGPKHQLVGHPAPVQGEMQLQCQLVANGLYCGDPSGYEDPRAASLRAGANDWRLLLQLDSDDNAEMMWGDCGSLYFWLTEDALRRQAFAESWMILQCA